MRFNYIEAEVPNGYPVHNLNTGLNYTTIQEAIGASETLDGHTIFVEKGEYHENVVVNKTLTLTGESMETTIIDGSGVGNVTQVTADDVIVMGFTIRNSEKWYPSSGIVLKDAKNCNISGNKMESNANGVMSFNSSNICLAKNKVENNSNGFMFYHLSNSIICGNNITANIIGISLTDSFNNMIYENNITANAYSLELAFSSENQICGNTVGSNSLGIVVAGSLNNTVFKNDLMENAGPGIQLTSSSHGNVVYGNNVTANNSGVLITNSSNNTVCRNDVVDNEFFGIQLWDAASNSIYENNVVHNHPGAYLCSSLNNVIFHNNFIGNSAEVISAGNIWDQGYPSGGNYYDNYSCVDLKSGPYQNETGSDGIGDTTYTINEANVDNYPLMGMFHGSSTSLAHAVTAISNSTIGNFQYFDSNSTIVMHVSNMTANQTFGFVQICIPHALMNTTYRVTINSAEPNYVNYALYDNGTHRWIYFSYQHSTLEVIIIPEFAPFAILLLFMIATLLAIVIHKRKHALTIDKG